MHFFEKQKIDETGKLAVKLEKAIFATLVSFFFLVHLLYLCKSTRYLYNNTLKKKKGVLIIFLQFIYFCHILITFVLTAAYRTSIIGPIFAFAGLLVIIGITGAYKRQHTMTCVVSRAHLPHTFFSFILHSTLAFWQLN